ncbi:Phosphoribosylglycinamide formyltransferase 2 [Gossypium arboreum]|uniref:Phosphoribosylglycinamide formyltransferase 2 n=1 Tax=Gossypium arboreum TaxID=29729 RepID=A0A0B0NIQ7_GOSAR|nr:Phosphoribosylglycinamide formyltransferase 2 [Gossypium arboreum]
MEFRPRPVKEQDLGLNRISCPYFVLSIAKLARGSRDVGGSFTLSTGSFGQRVTRAEDTGVSQATRACVTTRSTHTGIVMDPNRAELDYVESNAPAPTEKTALQESRPPTVSQGRGEGAREAFLHMMDAWYTEFVRMNLNAQPPPPPPIPQPISVAPRDMDFIRQNRPPVDKI